MESITRALFMIMALATSLFVAGCVSEAPERGGDLSDYDLPPDLAVLIHDSEAIVVAEYSEISDAGAVTLFVIPTPATPVTPGPPVLTTTLLLTELTVDTILKGDGTVTTTEPITYTSGGSLPVGTAQHEDDADSEWPHVWPVDTEFIMFIEKNTGEDTYHFPWGWCGRVLTGGAEVTCSDGDRTVMSFMSGVDRDDFIAAIQTEVANPSATETPYAGPTLTAEPPEPTP